MKPYLLLLLAGASCLVPPPCITRAQEPMLRYLLPVRDTPARASTVARWGLSAPVSNGFSDPNAIVYDQAYVDAYVAWAIDAPIACGAATYRLAMKDRVVEFGSGLDEAYLGQQLRADDLIRFVRARTEGKVEERTFRIGRADGIEALRER